MYDEIVRVYGENLVEADVSKTVTGDNPIVGGGTLGALVVNIFSSGDVTIASSESGNTFEILAAETADDEFSSIKTAEIPVGSYKDGELIATVEIPTSSPRLLKGKVTGATGNSGNIVATLGLLAR